MDSESLAIALWRRRFSESSLLVCWLTPEFGKIKTSARGALRHGGAFSGRVDLFHETHIRWKESSKSDIHTLTEAEIRLPFLPVGQGHVAFLVASYFTDLVEECVEPAHPVPEIYDLLSRALRYLREQPPALRAVFHFEKQLAACMGILNPDTQKSPHECLRDHLGHSPRLREELLQAGLQ